MTGKMALDWTIRAFGLVIALFNGAQLAGVQFEQPVRQFGGLLTTLFSLAIVALALTSRIKIGPSRGITK